MNIAYAVIDDGPICNPPPDNTTQTNLLDYFSIPIYRWLGMVIDIEIIAGAIILFVVLYKRKRGVGLNLKEN